MIEIHPFKEALESVAAKKLLPTTLSSAELAEVDADIRSRALFSAKVANARFLQEVRNEINKILTEGSSVDNARIQLQELLKKFSYAEGKGMGDLSSDARLRLLVETQVAMAQGYGRWKRQQTPIVLRHYPCNEFYRAEDRVEPRDWPERWANNGGKFYEGSSDYPEGRMIAPVNDPIWKAISAFGNPYPPFDYNSGMSVRPMSHDTAVGLGVISKDHVENPSEDPFGKGDQSDVSGLDPDMRKALIEGVGEKYKFSKGVLKLANVAVKGYEKRVKGKEVYVHPYSREEREKFAEKVKSTRIHKGDEWVPITMVGGVPMKRNDPKGGMKWAMVGGVPHLPGMKPLISVTHLRKDQTDKGRKAALKKLEKLKSAGYSAWANEPIHVDYQQVRKGGKIERIGGEHVPRKSLFQSEADAKKAYNNIIESAHRAAHATHVPSINVPQEWESPHVNLNPKSKYWAKGWGYGKGEVGQVQTVQNPAALAAAMEDKFERQHEFKPAFEKVKKKIEKEAENTESQNQFAANAMLFQADTAIRGGSSGDVQKGAKKSYGLCQLQVKHIKMSGVKKDSKGNVISCENIWVEAPGKGGKDQKYELSDPEGQVASYLFTVKTDPQFKADDLIFDTTYNEYTKYFKHKIGGDFVTHDLRTYGACEVFRMELRKAILAHPKWEKEKLVDLAMEHAAAKLGDTKNQAKKSYVDPDIYEELE